MRNIYLIILLGLLLFGCDKEEDPCNCREETGKIILKFHHYCDGKPLDFDVRQYVNKAGNEYLVNEIQYFISDLTLHSSEGNYIVDEWKDIHYVDSDISATHEWKVYDEIPAGHYQKVTFTFGISEEKNQSLMYTDPPESLMFWPEYLGGGYHYLKLNGKWLDTNNFERPFNFHLGIGQVYDAQTGDITGFIQNYFDIELMASSFELTDNGEVTLNLVMHVDRWFKNPHTYNHDDWGGDIMQKQDAMKLGCENGHDVFELMSSDVN
jgi:hypothetical protein